MASHRGDEMALKDFVGKGVRNETSVAQKSSPAEGAQPTPPPATPTSSAPVALLDASVQFTGTINCRESIRIDGRCKGELYSDHAVIIGEPAVLRMAIEADSVVVAGQVDGDITARRKITLERTARVSGNLCTPGIVIQEGAKLEGRIVIGSEAEPKKRTDVQAEVQTEAEAPAEERAAASEPAAAKPRKPTPSAPPPAS